MATPREHIWPPFAYPKGVTSARLASDLDTLYELIEAWLLKATGGKVYPHEFPFNDPAELLSLCTVEDATGEPSKLINAWFFSRTATSEAMQTGLVNLGTYTFRIVGFYSDRTVQGIEYFNRRIVEAVRAEFRKHPDADKAEQNSSSIAGPLQVTNLDWGYLGDWLCGMAECTWTVEQEVLWNV